jgi:hypothetical protein
MAAPRGAFSRWGVVVYFFFDFFVFTLDPCGVMLTGFNLLAAGARASRPQQVWHF